MQTLKKWGKTLLLVAISPVMILLYAGTAASLSSDINPGYGMIGGSWIKVLAVVLVVVAFARLYLQFVQAKKGKETAARQLESIRQQNTRRGSNGY